MTCPHCATRSGVYDLRKVCCAARYLTDTSDNICAKYGHDIEDLRQEAKKQKKRPV